MLKYILLLSTYFLMNTASENAKLAVPFYSSEKVIIHKRATISC